MAINPDIRDSAYQFFIEEAPELLQTIEAGLLNLSSEHSTAQIHNIMRAAHSLKGGAASVELEAIASIAHRLETIFKALYSATLEIDTDLESQLLQAYDCLRLPLMEQIKTGYFDGEQALALADPIFILLEEQFQDAISQSQTYMPSSADLGVDMTKSIFEVDVAQGLEHLALVVANPSEYEVAGELRAQAEVFLGFAELLNEVEFGAIAQSALTAINAHPERGLEITQKALTDFESARQAVLTGNKPSVSSCAIETPNDFCAIPEADLMTQQEFIVSEQEDNIPLLEDIFGNALTTLEMDLEAPAEVVPRDIQVAEEDREFEETLNSPLETEVGTQVNPSPAEADVPDSSEIIDVEWVIGATNISEAIEEAPSLEEVFGNAFAMEELQASAGSSIVPLTSSSNSLQKQHSDLVESTQTPETLEVAVQSIEQLFESLPPIQELSTAKSELNSTASTTTKPPAKNKSEASPSSTLSVRVDSQRLERMNNLVGELAINRNGLSLQNEQLQDSVRELLNRFSRVQNLVGDLRKLSDQMLVGASSSGLIASNPGFFSVSSTQHSPVKTHISAQPTTNNQQQTTNNKQPTTNNHFDSLELDSYGVLHSKLQGLLEDMMQIEESVDDIVLFAKATDQTLEQQRQMLTQLRDELMWARMLPLGEVLNRFPRILRDLCTTHHKPVNLKLSGTSVLVDKAILEKLYDPLLHLLRNAFDHGIESPSQRRQKGKHEQGQIEIRAYHQGSQTIIEVRDDGQGLNFERIRTQAFEQGLLSAEQVATTANNRLSELIFEPGFSTASQVSELSGRGVGLDVVRSQMRSLKGTITVTSSPGEGTTFTLRLPLTLTIAKLLVSFVNSTALAIPSDSIEEIVIPKANQIKQSGSQQFLHWRGEVVPIYRLANLLHYSCPLPEVSPSRALSALPSPDSWSLPLLVLRQDQNFVALEIDRLVTEQELVIKPFGSAIAPPSCTYGCTILGDGSLIPVIDAALLLEQLLRQGTTTGAITTTLKESGAMAIGLLNASTANQHSKATAKTTKAPTILVVDDAVALRRTLALTLERSGCRVLQARDGREAIEQLHQSSSVDLVICDIEMPNMNGFEFLSARRQEPQLSKIPVVMLTSRSNDKHRWLAMQLGATGYFTKPYLEQEFLSAIKQLIGQNPPQNLPILQSHKESKV